MFTSGLFTPANAGSSNNVDFSGGVGFGSQRQSKSGVMITQETALSQAAVARSVKLLAESIAQMPCDVYKREGEERKKAPEHPLSDLLKYQPNQKDSAFEYFESGQGLLGVNGNHLAIIERNKNHSIKELIPIHRDKVVILKGSDGLPYYKIPEWDNKVLTMRDIHHVKGFSTDGYQGLSPLQTNTDTIGLALAVDEHAASSHSNGAVLSGVITRPKDSGTIGQDAINNIVDSFKNRHSGLRNKFGVAMLQEGMDYKQMAMTHEQAQLIESRKLSVADISRLYGIPLALLNETAGESYKSVEQNTLNYLTFALMPWIRRWESAMHRDLLQPNERKKYFIEFNFSGLIRGDIKTRYDAYAIARQWGWLSLNDIRRLENLPPVEGGNVYLTPLNMVDTKNQSIHEQLNHATPEQLKEIEILCRK